MLLRREPSATEAHRLLSHARSDELTYGEVGATETEYLPIGYRHDRHRRRIGAAASFDRAAAGLRSWQVHKGIGARVIPDEPITQVGASHLVVMRLGPVRVVAPVRIVHIIDETDRQGFAYGTLPGHPEKGEESFTVSRTSEGGTVFEITAFSRPSELLVRLGSPVARAVQNRTTERYLQALATWATGEK